MGSNLKLSRSGTTSPLGKCDDRLDIAMSTKLKEALRTLGALTGSAGIPAAEYARRILEEHAFGRLPILRGMVSREDGAGDGDNPG